VKKVLLVGGAGYVGSILARELLHSGYAVRILDRMYFGDQGVSEIRDKVELVEGDMRTVGPGILNDIHAVINVGGLSNDPTAEYNPQANHEMNTVATKKIADLCKKNGISRYILASSCSIYDTGEGSSNRDAIQDETSQVSPKSVYSKSKFEAERLLLQMVDDDFCPVILRKGTIYGFSPRMRYDLVINTFVKDALSKKTLTLFGGGQMWRPLVDIKDVARAYITAMEAPEEKVRGEIFNVCFQNFLIADLADRIKETLSFMGLEVTIKHEQSNRPVRNYRVDAQKIERVLGFKPKITVEESVKDMVEKIQKYNYTDFESPRYYNIRWMQLLEEAQKIIKVTGSVF
jgi:nucleoside-diphosphate-sugar epimerase